MSRGENSHSSPNTLPSRMVCQPMAMTPAAASGRMSRQGTVWALCSL